MGTCPQVQFAVEASKLAALAAFHLQVAALATPPPATTTARPHKNPQFLGIIKTGARGLSPMNRRLARGLEAIRGHRCPENPDRYARPGRPLLRASARASIWSSRSIWCVVPGSGDASRASSERIR